MTEIIIVSGFLGSGKTTFLNNILPLLRGRKAVLENEFGETGIDGYLITEDVPVLELVRGCICCSLLREFRKGLTEVIIKHEPEWLLIEPSGVSLLSALLKEAMDLRDTGLPIGRIRKITMAEAPEFLDFTESFGDFYRDQIINADVVFLTKTDLIGTESEIQKIIDVIYSLNPSVKVISSDYKKISKNDLIKVVIGSDTPGEETDKISDSVIKTGNGGGKRIDFSSLSFRNIRFKERKDFNKILRLLFSGRFGRVLRIKGYLTAGDEKLFANCTRCSTEIMVKEKEAQENPETLVVIGEKINKKRISEFLTGKNRGETKMGKLTPRLKINGNKSCRIKV